MPAHAGVGEAIEACLKEHGKLTRLAISRKTGLDETQVANGLYYLRNQGKARKELDGTWVLVPESERKEPTPASPKVEKLVPAPKATAPTTMRAIADKIAGERTPASPMTATEVLEQPAPPAPGALEYVDTLADATLTAIERVLEKEISRLELELNAARDALDAYRRRAYPDRGGA